MANPVIGEVAIELPDAHYRFVLGTYGQAAIERELGKPLGEVFKEGVTVGVRELLAIFYGGLLRHHDLSQRQASDVLDAVGMDRAGTIVAEAVQLAFPDAKTNPRKAKAAAGTGPAS